MMQPKYGHLVKMLDMLTSAYARSDIQNVKHGRALETNIGKLFSLLADGLEVIHSNAELVREWDDLEKAEGKVLDRYGANVGVERGAASDALYRIFIRVKMLAQLSGGDWDTVIYAASELLGIEYADLDSEDVYPAKIALYVDEDKLSEERLELIDQIAAAIKRVLTAGVGLRLYMRTYRTYRQELYTGNAAFILIQDTADPVTLDRTGRLEQPFSYGSHVQTSFDLYPPITRTEPLRASYTHTNAHGVLYHTHLTPKRID